MGTEGPMPLLNQSGGYFGAELATHERIRSVQSQIRIAIQNHHLLYTRSQAFPKDADLENHMKILQDLILSLGRTQLELMYQFKTEIKEKHGTANLHNVMAMYLGWPDRHEMYLYRPKENGAEADGDKRAQIMKKKPLLPHSARPKVKMQSLLKVNHNKSILTTRKESERLKAAATKQSESPTSVLKEAKKLQSVLKARNERLSQASVEFTKRPSTSDDKSGDADRDLKDSLSSGSMKNEDTATSLEDVTQDSFLGFFGLIHKDKSKNMVVNQKKRKRRSAAGQSNFHGDFSYFQAKRTYTKKTVASSSVPESPCSSQDVADVDENDGLSLTSTDKPSEPTSPEIPSSQDVGDSQEIATSQELSADVSAELAEGNNSKEIGGSVQSNLPDAVQVKMAGDGNSDGKTEPLTPDSDEILHSPGETGKDDVLHKETMETETVVQPLNEDSTSSQAYKKEDRECQAGLLNKDRTDGQTDSKEQNVGQLIIKEEEKIVEDSDANGSDMEICEAEILLRYSEETDTVEMLPSAIAHCVDHKPASDSEDRSNDTDPTSFMPDSKSQNAKSSHPSKSNDFCSVCLENSDAGTEKCSMCGASYHKECVPSPCVACPSCHATPSSISSIVGVNTASRLTSTDCSEVIRRYLDGPQDECKDDADIRDNDNSENNTDISEYTDDQNCARIVDHTVDRDHDDLNDSIDDRMDLEDSAEDIDHYNEDLGDIDTNEYTDDQNCANIVDHVEDRDHDELNDSIDDRMDLEDSAEDQGVTDIDPYSEVLDGHSDPKRLSINELYEKMFGE